MRVPGFNEEGEIWDFGAFRPKMFILTGCQGLGGSRYLKPAPPEPGSRAAYLGWLKCHLYLYNFTF